ncbi:MAG: ribosome hibernation-promoting factor, HPF/YfiA family [Fibrobacterota bacterium]
MAVNITARHFDASDSLKEALMDKFEHTQRFYDGVIDADIVLEKNKPHDEHALAEVTLITRSGRVVATAKAENVGKVVELVFDKLEVQLKKINEKQKNHRVKKDL